MRVGLIIIAITTFLVVNTYYDGKYTKMFHINKKYIQMATYGFVGLSLYLFVKRIQRVRRVFLNMQMIL